MHRMCNQQAANMPTLNPRLTVTLRPSTAATLRRLSELTGNSQSAMVSELLEESEPIFQRMTVVLEAAQKAQNEAKAGMVEGMGRAQSRIEESLGIIHAQFDEYTGDLLAGLENVNRRARKTSTRQPAGGASAAAAPTATASKRPPLSNRGVRNTANKEKQQLTRTTNGGEI